MELSKSYAKFRQQGEPASRALRNARTIEKWEAEGDSVRIRAEDECEGYFDVYGEPDTKKEREEIEAAIERCGCLWLVAEYLDPLTGKWECGDSIGMVVEERPLDPYSSCYVPDLMRSTLDALEVARSPSRRVAEARKLIVRAAQLLPEESK